MSAARSRELCIMACTFCRDPMFWRWMEEMAQQAGLEKSEDFDEESAKVFITATCWIKSRNELDTNPDAAEKFHRMIRLPFIEWKNMPQQVLGRVH
jgi:hypothetical protein